MSNLKPCPLCGGEGENIKAALRLANDELRQYRDRCPYPWCDKDDSLPNTRIYGGTPDRAERAEANGDNSRPQWTGDDNEQRAEWRDRVLRVFSSGGGEWGAVVHGHLLATTKSRSHAEWICEGAAREHMERQGKDPNTRIYGRTLGQESAGDEKHDRVTNALEVAAEMRGAAECQKLRDALAISHRTTDNYRAAIEEARDAIGYMLGGHTYGLRDALNSTFAVLDSVLLKESRYDKKQKTG